MEESLKKKLDALKLQARKGGVKSKPSSRGRSSLHQIIKTKQQADRLMTLLQSA